MPESAQLQGEKPPSASHYNALDGLRGLAVLLVVFCHADYRFKAIPSSLEGIYRFITSAGWNGVDLFFVLSGFLITGILFDNKGDPHYFKNFYGKRILRIFPLYYGYLILIFLVTPHLNSEYLPLFQSTTILKTSLLTFTFNLISKAWIATPLVFTIFWSLAVEEHFYLMWPFAVSLLNRRQLSLACICVALFSLVARIALLVVHYKWRLVYMFTLCRFDGLCAGAFLALQLREANDWRKTARYAVPALFSSLALVIGISLIAHRFVWDLGSANREDLASCLILSLGIFSVSVFFASLVTLCLSAPGTYFVRRVFESKILRSVGKYSFGIYVYHAATVVIFTTIDERLSTELHWNDYLPHRVLFALSIALASYMIAFLSYNGYETHFLKLKKYFTSTPGGEAKPLRAAR